MANEEALQAPMLLDRTQARSAFDCGVPPLNDYLKQYALQNQKKDAARTYVATRGKRIVGYYTLAYGAVAPEDAPLEVKAGLARYPIPVILLVWLAVDVREKGKGLGGGLLKDALLRTLQAAQIAGLWAMLVPAKDDAARAFYQKYGFVPSPTDEYHLLLKLTDIHASLVP